MSRRQKDPLRSLTDEERQELTRLSRSPAAPAVRVARAVMLLAVADGSDYQEAARTAGRKSGDAVSHLVARFNREGSAALDPRHGGGHQPTYDTAARDRILREAARVPTPETDGRLVMIEIRLVAAGSESAAGEALALGVGMLKVKAGYHYPSDVAAGALVGGAMGLLVPMLHSEW